MSGIWPSFLSPSLCSPHRFPRPSGTGVFPGYKGSSSRYKTPLCRKKSAASPFPGRVLSVIGIGRRCGYVWYRAAITEAMDTSIFSTIANIVCPAAFDTSTSRTADSYTTTAVFLHNPGNRIIHNIHKRTMMKTIMVLLVLASSYLPGPLPAKYCQRQ